MKVPSYRVIVLVDNGDDDPITLASIDDNQLAIETLSYINEKSKTAVPPVTPPTGITLAEATKSFRGE